ncbi:MAG: hypothetical protein PHV75_09290 [Victivallaceae bacterium]|nr:hypothetical protein [Victivallaceae bacterium]
MFVHGQVVSHAHFPHGTGAAAVVNRAPSLGVYRCFQYIVNVYFGDLPLGMYQEAHTDAFLVSEGVPEFSSGSRSHQPSPTAGQGGPAAGHERFVLDKVHRVLVAGLDGTVCPLGPVRFMLRDQGGVVRFNDGC